MSDRKGGPVAISGRFALDLVGHSSTHPAVTSISVRCQCTAVLAGSRTSGLRALSVPVPKRALFSLLKSDFEG